VTVLLLLATNFFPKNSKLPGSSEEEGGGEGGRGREGEGEGGGARGLFQLPPPVPEAKP